MKGQEQQQQMKLTKQQHNEARGTTANEAIGTTTDKSNRNNINR